jgi:hypothetical protein
LLKFAKLTEVGKSSSDIKRSKGKTYSLTSNTAEEDNGAEEGICLEKKYVSSVKIRMYRNFRLITRTPNIFDIPFDVFLTRPTLTSGRVRKYTPLLTEDTGVIPKNVPG